MRTQLASLRRGPGLSSRVGGEPTAPVSCLCPLGIKCGLEGTGGLSGRLSSEWSQATCRERSGMGWDSWLQSPGPH